MFSFVFFFHNNGSAKYFCQYCICSAYLNSPEFYRNTVDKSTENDLKFHFDLLILIHFALVPSFLFSAVLY